MRIAVAADHRGFDHKGPVTQALRAAGHEVRDFGTTSTAAVDYPDYAIAVGEAVRSGEADVGILICGSGAGVSIAANKLRGVRAALCHDLFTARQAREDDDANVLCLGADVVGVEFAIELVRTFVGARFSHAERHARRLAKVLALERREAGGVPEQRRPLEQAPDVAAARERLEAAGTTARLWARDASLWSGSDEARAGIQARLGWLDLTRMHAHIPDLAAFADEVRAEGVRDVVLLGMGGSSLAADVFANACPAVPGAPRLTVLDTTDPWTIRTVHERIALARTLFIVSSKSGTTVETLALCQYFWREAEATSASPGARFVAITDPGSPLERLAMDWGFRRTFLNPPDIGGRFSALSLFGLVPAAILGIDPAGLLESADTMARACSDRIPVEEHPALGLAAVLAGCAAAGRDKVTLLLSPALRSFGAWLEQLLTESTGKHGLGLVAVHDEPEAPPETYGDDRLFVGIANGADTGLEQRLARLEAVGHPVVRLAVSDPVALTGEFLRWELAIAAVGSLLGVNPFDEPDVARAKEATHAALATVRETGQLPHWPTDDVDDLIRMLERAAPPDWLALLVYLAPRPTTLDAVHRLRSVLLETTGCATMVGIGPRYLHSTGQLLKGGPPTSITLLLTAEDGDDVPIPGEAYGFATLKRAQALGDLGTLRAGHRRIVWLNLDDNAGRALDQLASLLEGRLVTRTPHRRALDTTPHRARGQAPASATGG